MTHSIRVRTGSRDAVVRNTVQQLVRRAAIAVRQRGRCALAIPGGSVAEAILPPFSGTALPWGQVHLFWVDDRIVPVTSRDSNAGQAMALIADSPMARDAHIHTMTDTFDEGLYTGRMLSPPEFEVAAARYTNTLVEIAGTPPILDIALLGVGDDGHVASLFPGSQFMNATLQPVIVEYASPKAPRVRMSLSAPVLVNARHVIIVAFGVAKAAAVAAALEDEAVATPVAYVLRMAHQVTVLLDHDAASRLTYTTQEPIP